MLAYLIHFINPSIWLSHTLKHMMYVCQFIFETFSWVRSHCLIHQRNRSVVFSALKRERTGFSQSCSLDPWCPNNIVIHRHYVACLRSTACYYFYGKVLWQLTSASWISFTMYIYGLNTILTHLVLIVTFARVCDWTLPVWEQGLKYVTTIEILQ